MKSLLPNCRFLFVTSQHAGRDWAECATKIDNQLDELGMDLAEESVYLLFDRAPGSIINGDGGCRIARPVVGPKKNLNDPFGLFDWVQAPVERRPLRSTDWDQILEECYQEWESLQRQGLKLAAPFMIVAKKRLIPELSLTIEVLFHE